MVGPVEAPVHAARVGRGRRDETSKSEVHYQAPHYGSIDEDLPEDKQPTNVQSSLETTMQD
jgi:hypothetical protein